MNGVNHDHDASALIWERVSSGDEKIPRLKLSDAGDDASGYSSNTSGGGGGGGGGSRSSVESKEYRVLKKEGASSRNFVYTLDLAIKPKKSGKFKNHATCTISIDN